MSRWIVALVAFSFALAPLRAADPKPQWEIDTFPNSKRMQLVRWVSYSPDGKTLLAQVEDECAFDDIRCTSRLFSWDVANQKELLNLALGKHVYFGSGMYANAATKVGTVLVACGLAEEVRLTDGTRSRARELQNSPLGVWLNLKTSDSLWLRENDRDDYRLAYGKMPPIEANKGANDEKWLKAKLAGDFSDGPPVFTAIAISLPMRVKFFAILSQRANMALLRTSNILPIILF